MAIIQIPDNVVSVPSHKPGVAPDQPRRGRSARSATTRLETPVTCGRRCVRRRAVMRPSVRRALVALSATALLVAGAPSQNALAAQNSAATLVPDPASLVNTVVQTGVGNDFPGAQAPFGM